MLPNTPHHTTELYSYYHTPIAMHASCVPQDVAGVHADLRRLIPGLQTRLLRRDDLTHAAYTNTNTNTTWMEVFSHPQGLSEAMMALITRATANTPTQRLGPRVTERFSADWLEMMS